MDPDRFVALVFGIIAALMLLVGICCVLVGAESERRRPTPPPAFQAPDLDSEAARRYHGSDQWGR